MSGLRFTLLLVLTLLVGAGLAVSIMSTPHPATRGGGPIAAFPLLAEAPEEAAQILVTRPEGSYRLQRSAAAGLWLLPDKGGYPAESRKIAKLLNGLAGLTLYEAKTAQPENLDLLDLAGPREGPHQGPRIQVFDAAGQPLADAVIGKTRENLGQIGRDGLYLRYSDGDQAWLALGDLVVPQSALALLDQSLVSLPASVIARIEVTPPDGSAPLVAERPSRDTTAFRLEPPPEGAAAAGPALSAMAGALRTLVFDDVRPAEALEMAAPWRARFTTFDGIGITLTFVLAEGRLWARIAAEAQPPAADQAVRPDANAFAAALSERTRGWVFRLDPALFRILAKGREALLGAGR